MDIEANQTGVPFRNILVKEAFDFNGQTLMRIRDITAVGETYPYNAVNLATGNPLKFDGDVIVRRYSKARVVVE